MSTMRCANARSIGPTRMSRGIETNTATNAPIRPASRPTSAPSPGVIIVAVFCCSTYAATTPPQITHPQQHTLNRLTSGSADSTPMTTPPMSAGWPKLGLVVILTAEMRDELFALQEAQRVLQLHELNEQIVLGIDRRRVHRTLEVEREPLLDAVHVRALREVEKQRDVEDDRRREDAVAAEEVDLQLHRVPEPADEIDVVPPFLVVAARRIVVDPHHVAQVLVEIGIQLRLQDVVEHRFLALLLRFEGLRIVEHLAVAVAEDVRRVPALDAEETRLETRRDNRLDQRLAGLQVLAGEGRLRARRERDERRDVGREVRRRVRVRNPLADRRVRVHHARRDRRIVFFERALERLDCL